MSIYVACILQECKLCREYSLASGIQGQDGDSEASPKSRLACIRVMSDMSSLRPLFPTTIRVQRRSRSQGLMSCANLTTHAQVQPKPFTRAAENSWI